MKIVASGYIVKHSSYTGAVTEMLKIATDKGYTVDEEDIFTQITTGNGKPKEGATKKHHLGLSKNGKKSKKVLHGQVYRDGTFELNAYIN